MRTILVMRHAKSSWDTDHNLDFDRPLSERGLRDARTMGNWLSAQEYTPDLILSSPARRALNTAQIVADVLGAATVETDEMLYLASAGQIAKCINGQPAFETALIIGHNPGMEDFVQWCCGGIDSNDDVRKLMPTGAVYVIGVSQAEVGPGSGQLLEHQRPKSLRT